MHKFSRPTLTVLAALVIGLGSVGLTAPAASAASTSCSRTDDVCRVSTYSGGGSVYFSTYFPNVSGGTGYWEIRRSGQRLCYGYMGYRDTKSCRISGSGNLTFGFWKGQNAQGNISLTSN